jgi:hypothetical protein
MEEPKEIDNFVADALSSQVGTESPLALFAMANETDVFITSNFSFTNLIQSSHKSLCDFSKTRT